MWIKKTCIVLAGTLFTSLVTTSMVQAEDVKGSLSIIYSPHTTHLSAPGYLQANFQLPKDHENKGKGYYGVQGEVNYGKYLLSINYLTGTSNTIVGGVDETSSSPTFNPLTHETSEVLDLCAGYTVLEGGTFGKVTPTLGYFRMWASPTISAPNWYDGLEFGVKGSYKLHDRLMLTYKYGYVPDVVVHGYMIDGIPGFVPGPLMAGRYLVNYMIGAEVLLSKDISVIGGYQNIRAVNKVVVDGSQAIVKFTGLYVGGSYNF